MKRRTISIAAMTVSHAVVTILLTITLLNASPDAIDDPENRIHTILKVQQVLLWPVFRPFMILDSRWFHDYFAGFMGIVPFLLNSLSWAITLLILWEWIQHKIRPNKQIQAIAAERGSA